MKLTYRYLVPMIENTKIQMPIGTQILSAEIDNGELYVNVIMDQDQGRKKFYHFKILSVNQPVESIFGFDFLSTVQGIRHKYHIFVKKD